MKEFVVFHGECHGWVVEMGKQLFGVYTRIRAPAPYGSDRLAQQGGKRLIEQFLHGEGIRLDLPTVVGAAVESDFDEISLMGGFHGGKGTDFVTSYLPFAVFALPFALCCAD